MMTSQKEIRATCGASHFVSSSITAGLRVSLQALPGPYFQSFPIHASDYNPALFADQTPLGILAISISGSIPVASLPDDAVVVSFWSFNNRE